MERKLSAQSAQQLKESQAKLEALQREYQFAQMAQQNIILSAALELGMSKDELDGSVINLTADGYVFAPKSELKAVEGKAA